MKDIILYSFIAPIILSLIGILCNIIGYLNQQASALNFIFSITYCVIWGILFYFAPKQNLRALHISYLIWWLFSLIFGIGIIFSYYLTGGGGFDWSIVPSIIFIAPIAGLRYPFTSSIIGNYLIAFICFLFFVIALCQYLIARNMKSTKEDWNLYIKKKTIMVFFF